MKLQLQKDLLALRELFQGGKKWIKGCYAQDKTGVETQPTNEYAEVFCLTGGIMKITAAGGGSFMFDSMASSEVLDRRREMISALNLSRVGHGGEICDNDEHEFGHLVGYNDHPSIQFSNIDGLITRAIEDLELP